MSHVEGSPLRSKQGIFTQLSKSKQGIFIQLSKSKQGIFIRLSKSKQGIFIQLSKSKQGIFILLSKSKQGIFIQLSNTLVISQGEISQTARKIKTFKTTIRINERTNIQVNNSDLQYYSDLQPLHRFFFLFTALPHPVNWAEACGLWCFSQFQPQPMSTQFHSYLFFFRPRCALGAFCSKATLIRSTDSSTGRHLEAEPFVAPFVFIHNHKHSQISHNPV